MDRATRLFFATDIHASNRCFKKFLNAAKHYRADVLVLGGDVTGKDMVPIVMTSGGRAIAKHMGSVEDLETDTDITDFEQRVADSGSYTYRCTPEEYDRISKDPTAFNRVFSSLIKARMRQWVGWADERLRGQGVRAFFNAGNDDTFAIDSIIDSSETLTRPEGKCVEIDEHCTMISCGFANLTPFHTPRDVPEEELARKIASMVSQVPDLRRCIFNLHCPPYRSQLDNAPALGPDLRPKMSALGVEFAPVGSTAVRAAIEQHQPLLGLHGHVHESKGSTRIGNTLCLNPGSEYKEGILRGALIQLTRGQVSNFAFTTG